MTDNILYFNNFCRSGKARILRVAYQIGAWTPPPDIQVWWINDRVEIQHKSFRLVVCPLAGVEVNGSALAARRWIDDQVTDHPR